MLPKPEYPDELCEVANSHREIYEPARKFLHENGFAMYGKCSCPKLIYQCIPLAPDELSYMDSEGYSAEFLTGQDFGCIHHQPT
jgi:hypothetical protein